jgi:hypothetical protein
MPVTLSGVRKLPSSLFWDAKLEEIAQTGSYPFPMFPDNHP